MGSLSCCEKRDQNPPKNYDNEPLRYDAEIIEQLEEQEKRLQRKEGPDIQVLQFSPNNGLSKSNSQRLNQGEQERASSRQKNKEMKDAVEFINNRLYDLSAPNESFQEDLKTKDKMLTPGATDQDLDEDNVIIFHDKKQLERFFSEFQSLQNYLLVQTKKFFVPTILCNSPRDLKREALIILRNCDKIQNFQIKHMKGNKLADNFKVHHFAFLNNNPIAWKEQLINDLQNFYQNEGLELIGAVNDTQAFACRDVGKQVGSGMKITTRNSELRGGSFYLLFYKQPNYHKGQEFRFFIEMVYEDLSQAGLQEILNKKFLEERAVYRTCLTVYERQNIWNVKNSMESKSIRSGSSDGFMDEGWGVYCHIIVFEKMLEADVEDDLLYMVQSGNLEMSFDAQQNMSQFLYETEICQKFKIAGFLPKQKLEDSLFVFAAD